MPGITQALIIAAGNGSRLQPASGDLPKPLTPVCGVPLLKRLLYSAYLSGIRSCVIVIGYEGDALRRQLESDPDIKVKIQWVMNEEWRKANGVSVLKAKDYIDDDFVLLMADHLFQAKTLSRFLRRRPSPGEVILAVDRKVHNIYDIDDATKTQLNGRKILQIGKSLKEFNAVDTGMFLCTPELFEILERKKAEKGGDCSLTDGMQELIEQQKLRYYDIKGGWWLDVDTPTALRYAEKALYDSLRKPSDGFFAKHFYRPLSLRITKKLVDKPINGRHMAWMTLILGLLASLSFAFATPWSMVAGAALFLLASIFSGCDGELAKIKLQDSAVRKKWDTLTNTAVFLSFLFGVMVGYFRQIHEPYVLFVGLFTMFDAGLVFHFMHHHVQKQLAYVQFRGTMDHHHLDHEPERPQDMMSRLMHYARAAVRPDFLAFAVLILAFTGKLSLIFWLVFLTTHVSAILTLSEQAKVFRGSEKSAVDSGLIAS